MLRLRGVGMTQDSASLIAQAVACLEDQRATQVDMIQGLRDLAQLVEEGGDPDEIFSRWGTWTASPSWLRSVVMPTTPSATSCWTWAVKKRPSP